MRLPTEPPHLRTAAWPQGRWYFCCARPCSTSHLPQGDSPHFFCTVVAIVGPYPMESNHRRVCHQSCLLAGCPLSCSDRRLAGWATYTTVARRPELLVRRSVLQICQVNHDVAKGKVTSTPCLEYATVSAVSNAGNPCAWRFFICAVRNHVGIFFRFEANGWLRLCANISVFVPGAYKPAQMQDPRAQTNLARTNAGLTRTNGHSAPDLAVSAHNYAPIVGRILQTQGTCLSLIFFSFICNHIHSS